MTYLSGIVTTAVTYAASYMIKNIAASKARRAELQALAMKEQSETVQANIQREIDRLDIDIAKAEAELNRIQGEKSFEKSGIYVALGVSALVGLILTLKKGRNP